MIYYIIGIVSLVIIDQLTKLQIENNFFIGETIPVISDFFHITYVQNRGIAFGVFQGKINIISIVTILAVIIFIVYFFKIFKKSNFLEKLSYMFIIAGALGNIIDRIFRGYVVDMLDFRGIWAYVFNMADVYINFGVILVLIEILLKSKNDKSQN